MRFGWLSQNPCLCHCRAEVTGAVPVPCHCWAEVTGAVPVQGQPGPPRAEGGPAPGKAFLGPWAPGGVPRLDMIPSGAGCTTSARTWLPNHVCFAGSQFLFPTWLQPPEPEPCPHQGPSGCPSPECAQSPARTDHSRSHGTWAGFGEGRVDAALMEKLLRALWRWERTQQPLSLLEWPLPAQNWGIWVASHSQTRGGILSQSA